MTFKEVGDLINVRVFFLKIWEKTWVKTSHFLLAQLLLL
jgi:hypothetical protein